MRPRSAWDFGGIDVVGTLASLRHASVNYTPGEISRANWHFDTQRTPLPSERPGPPADSGTWAIACSLVQQYEFCVPELVRAVYDPADALLGRTMLLQTRFYGLHFYCGVRITTVIDETTAEGDRVWGWAYETLQGHLERGRITYEVVKQQETGRVEFVINSYSQAARTLGPVLRLGWRLFGRRTQLRFYRDCGARLTRLVKAIQPGAPPPAAHVTADGLIRAPSDARTRLLDRFAVRRRHPG